MKDTEDLYKLAIAESDDDCIRECDSIIKDLGTSNNYNMISLKFTKKVDCTNTELVVLW
jgi:hypothetical protein